VTVTAETAPRSPKGLGPGGRRLWRETFRARPDGSRLQLRPDEATLLVEACHLVDHLDRLRAVLEDAPLTVKGSAGQPVGDPVRAEYHRAIGSLDRLVRTLALPDSDAAGASSPSWAGRNLARARWSA
jgi:hypothetical protein